MVARGVPELACGGGGADSRAPLRPTSLTSTTSCESKATTSSWARLVLAGRLAPDVSSGMRDPAENRQALCAAGGLVRSDVDRGSYRRFLVMPSRPANVSLTTVVFTGRRLLGAEG